MRIRGAGLRLYKFNWSEFRHTTLCKSGPSPGPVPQGGVVGWGYLGMCTMIRPPRPRDAGDGSHVVRHARFWGCVSGRGWAVAALAFAASAPPVHPLGLFPE
ncbi:hypothetical protein SLA2020_337720 [Shorea laevis]